METNETPVTETTDPKVEKTNETPVVETTETKPAENVVITVSAENKATSPVETIVTANVDDGKPKEIVYPHMELIAEEKIDVEKLPKEIRQKVGIFKATFSRFQKNKSPKMGDGLIKTSVMIADEITDFLEKELPEKPVVPVDTRKPIEKEELTTLLRAGIANTDLSDELIVEQIITAYKIEKEEIVIALSNLKEEIKTQAEQSAKERNARNINQRRELRRPIQGNDTEDDEVERGLRNRIPRTIRTPIIQRNPAPLTKEQMILKALDANGCIHFRELSKILGRSVGIGTVTEGAIKLSNVYMTDFYQLQN